MKHFSPYPFPSAILPIKTQRACHLSPTSFPKVSPLWSSYTNCQHFIIFGKPVFLLQLSGAFHKWFYADCGVLKMYLLHYWSMSFRIFWKKIYFRKSIKLAKFWIVHVTREVTVLFQFYMFYRPSVMLGLKFQLPPRKEDFKFYSTINWIHDRVVSRIWQYLMI